MHDVARPIVAARLVAQCNRRDIARATMVTDLEAVMHNEIPTQSTAVAFRLKSDTSDLLEQ